jgi:hypothetical protein
MAISCWIKLSVEFTIPTRKDIFQKLNIFLIAKVGMRGVYAKYLRTENTQKYNY